MIFEGFVQPMLLLRQKRLQSVTYRHPSDSSMPALPMPIAVRKTNTTLVDDLSEIHLKKLYLSWSRWTKQLVDK